MRIALLTDGIFPYVIGGMQKHSYYLTKYFAKREIHVDLYHTNQSKYDISKLEFFTDEEKQYIRSIVIDFPEQDKFPGHYIRASFKYSERIYEQFKKNQDVDFIYIQGFCGWKLLQEKKNKILFPLTGVHFHGLEMFQQSINLKDKLEKILFYKNVLFNFKHSDFVFSLGGKLTSILINKKIAKERILEISLGIDAKWINPNIEKNRENERKFIFIGRYERRKGIEELMKVIMDLENTHKFHLEFIGTVPEHLKIKSPHIHYHGVITEQTQIQAILRQCDVLVCPSYSEGMPNVIMEAMASGLAVIATDVGAVNIMVSEKTGWLIQPGNKEQLKKAITEAINTDSNKLLSMKQQARDVVRNNFLWDTIINKTISEIKNKLKMRNAKDANFFPKKI